MKNGKLKKSGKQGVKVAKAKGRSGSTKRTPFQLFVTSCRVQLMKTLVAERPSYHEFCQLCSNRWKSMSTSERKPFELMATQPNEEMKSRESRGRKKLSNLKKMRFKKAPGPEKPLTSFFWYCWDERPKVMKDYPNLKMTEVLEIFINFIDGI